MIFQKVLKGISGLSSADATNMVTRDGILSNWWRKKGTITSAEIQEELSESNLLAHLNNYNQALPVGHKWSHLGLTYGEVSAFISTSAGAVERDQFLTQNIIFPSFITSLRFATKNFKTSGYIFYAYVMVLGKMSIPLQAFSEEVRELHIFRNYLPYQPQGEITAKICIPSVNIEKGELYDGPPTLASIAGGLDPIPTNIIVNPNYQTPNSFSNIRDFF